MAEKKPGLLKRIFSFGFGKKAEPEAEEPVDTQVDELAETSPVAEAPIVEDDPVEAPADKKTPAEAPVAKAKDEPAKPEPVKQVPAETVKKRKAEQTDKKTDEKPSGKPVAPVQESKKPAPKKKAEKSAKPKKTGSQKSAKPAEPAAKPVLAKSEPGARPKGAAAPEEKPVAREPQPVEKPKPAPEIETKPAVQTRPETFTDTEPAAPAAKIEPEPIAERAIEPAEETRREGWFQRLRSGLSRSSEALTGNIASVFTKRKLDEDTLQELEDILIQADLGVETAMSITDALSAGRYGKDIDEREVRTVMAAEIEKVLEPVAQPLELDLTERPHVILVVGVNGSGKTTTIGKLTAKLRRGGYSTLLVAGDTFRAAAIEQLKIWGERTSSPVVARTLGADAAGLAFDAYAEAKAGDHDVMIMDTAGRLQNKTELMAELEKIIRVLRKQDPQAPHTVLLTLDATTGQNALNQVEIFGRTAGVNGLVMTKLDGTARGGILVAISAKHKLPVYFIGVGEQVDDLEPFEAGEFARSIAGLAGEMEQA